MPDMCPCHLTWALYDSHSFLKLVYFRNSVADTPSPSNCLLKKQQWALSKKRSVWTTECCLRGRQAGRGSSRLPTPTTPNTKNLSAQRTRHRKRFTKQAQENNACHILDLTKSAPQRARNEHRHQGQSLKKVNEGLKVVCTTNTDFKWEERAVVVILCHK